VETPYHFAQKQDRISAFDMFFQNVAQDFMIDVCEEFSDIALQNPDCPRVIPRNFAGVVAEAIYRSVRAFDAPTRVRIENELGIEVRIQNPIYGVVQQPVPNGRFVNVARFGIIDPERLIGPVTVRLIEKVAMQRENMVGQVKRISLDVFAAALVTKKFTPRSEQIFYGDDIMVDVTRPHSSLSLSQFRLDFESDQRGVFDLD